MSSKLEKIALLMEAESPMFVDETGEATDSAMNPIHDEGVDTDVFNKYKPKEESPKNVSFNIFKRLLELLKNSPSALAFTEKVKDLQKDNIPKGSDDFEVLKSSLASINKLLDDNFSKKDDLFKALSGAHDVSESALKKIINDFKQRVTPKEELPKEKPSKQKDALIKTISLASKSLHGNDPKQSKENVNKIIKLINTSNYDDELISKARNWFNKVFNISPTKAQNPDAFNFDSVFNNNLKGISKPSIDDSDFFKELDKFLKGSNIIHDLNDSDINLENKLDIRKNLYRDFNEFISEDDPSKLIDFEANYEEGSDEDKKRKSFISKVNSFLNDPTFSGKSKIGRVGSSEDVIPTYNLEKNPEEGLEPNATNFEGFSGSSAGSESDFKKMSDKNLNALNKQKNKDKKTLKDLTSSLNLESIEDWKKLLAKSSIVLSNSLVKQEVRDIVLDVIDDYEYSKNLDSLKKGSEKLDSIINSVEDIKDIDSDTLEVNPNKELYKRPIDYPEGGTKQGTEVDRYKVVPELKNVQTRDDLSQDSELSFNNSLSKNTEQFVSKVKQEVFSAENDVLEVLKSSYPNESDSINISQLITNEDGLIDDEYGAFYLKTLPYTETRGSAGSGSVMTYLDRFISACQPELGNKIKSLIDFGQLVMDTNYVLYNVKFKTETGFDTIIQQAAVVDDESYYRNVEDYIKHRVQGNYKSKELFCDCYIKKSTIILNLNDAAQDVLGIDTLILGQFLEIPSESLISKSGKGVAKAAEDSSKKFKIGNSSDVSSEDYEDYSGEGVFSQEELDYLNSDEYRNMADDE